MSGGIFLIKGWYRSAQPTVGGATPAQVVLRCTQRQAEQANNQCFSVVSASSSSLGFSQWSICKVKGTPLLPKVVLVSVLSQQRENTRTVSNPGLCACWVTSSSGPLYFKDQYQDQRGKNGENNFCYSLLLLNKYILSWPKAIDIFEIGSWSCVTGWLQIHCVVEAGLRASCL